MNKEEAYNQAIKSILTMNRTLRNYSKQAHAERITGRQLSLLKYLLDSGERSAGELARYLFISESSVSEQLRKLDRKGFLVKDRAENDNRVVTASITETGKKLVQRMPAGGIQLLRERLKELDVSELEKIIKIVEKLNLLMETSITSNWICLPARHSSGKKHFEREETWHYC